MLGVHILPTFSLFFGLFDQDVIFGNFYKNRNFSYQFRCVSPSLQYNADQDSIGELIVSHTGCSLMSLLSPVTETARGFKTFLVGYQWLRAHPKQFGILLIPMGIGLLGLATMLHRRKRKVS